MPKTARQAAEQRQLSDILDEGQIEAINAGIRDALAKADRHGTFALDAAQMAVGHTPPEPVRNLLFLVDASGSMGGSEGDFARLYGAVERALAEADGDGIHRDYAVVTFSYETKHLGWQPKSRRKVLSALLDKEDPMRGAGGGTDPDMRVVRQLLAAAQGRSAVVLVSDGEMCRDDKVVEALRELSGEGVRIGFVEVSDSRDSSRLGGSIRDIADVVRVSGRDRKVLPEVLAGYVRHLFYNEALPSPAEMRLAQASMTGSYGALIEEILVSVESPRFCSHESNMEQIAKLIAGHKGELDPEGLIREAVEALRTTQNPHSSFRSQDTAGYVVDSIVQGLYGAGHNNLAVDLTGLDPSCVGTHLRGTRENPLHVTYIAGPERVRFLGYRISHCAIDFRGKADIVGSGAEDSSITVDGEAAYLGGCSLPRGTSFRFLGELDAGTVERLLQPGRRWGWEWGGGKPQFWDDGNTLYATGTDGMPREIRP